MYAGIYACACACACAWWNARAAMAMSAWTLSVVAVSFRRCRTKRQPPRRRRRRRFIATAPAPLILWETGPAHCGRASRREGSCPGKQSLRADRRDFQLAFWWVIAPAVSHMIQSHFPVQLTPPPGHSPIATPTYHFACIFTYCTCAHVCRQSPVKGKGNS